jgi:hypothetical protein
MPIALLPAAPASTKTFAFLVVISTLKILPVGIDPVKSFVPEMAMPSGWNPSGSDMISEGSTVSLLEQAARPTRNASPNENNTD